MVRVFIQARMSSSRLPHKTLADVAGEPMLGHVLRRARSIPGVDNVIVATTHNPIDVAIVRFASENRAPVYLGSENDVLDRFYQTAKHFGVTTIVRVTPDCPLLDPDASGLVLDCFVRSGGALDIACNTQPPTYPDGLDTEVFSLNALARAWRYARMSSEREHVTSYMYNNPSVFHIGNVTNVEDLSHLRWTVDDSRDLEFIRAIYGCLHNTSYAMDDIMDVLTQHPEMKHINSGIARNVGYMKSLREDMTIHPRR